MTALSLRLSTIVFMTKAGTSDTNIYYYYCIILASQYFPAPTLKDEIVPQCSFIKRYIYILSSSIPLDNEIYFFDKWANLCSEELS